MAERKARPQVAKPSARRRLIELGKDLLIVALSCSALFLVTRTSLFEGLTWMAPPAATAPPQTAQPQAAVEPCLLAVRTDRGLYGAAYDAGVSRDFQRLSPLLGEGLSTAGAPTELSRRRWEALLEKPGLYCAFRGELPLSLLSAWLGSGGFPEEAAAEELLLARDGDGVWLCWRTSTGFRGALTQVAWTGHLESALEEFNPNGAAFAYALAENDDAYDTLDPYVLVLANQPERALCRVTRPDLVSDQAALETVLAALDFQNSSSAYQTPDGWLSISEGTDRLRVSRTGDVVYHAREESRYALPTDQPTAAQAAEVAWQLLDRVTAPWRGEGSLVLTGCEKAGESWTVTFQYRFAGTPLLVGEEGWGGQFSVQNGQLTDFTLRLRACAATGETSVLPPERLSAAALNSLDGAGDRLTLCYTDAGGEVLTAGWVV